VAEASIVRVITVEPTGVDVDLSLLDSDMKTLMHSNSIGGSEGILYEIPPGSYNLFFGYLNTIMESSPFKFCETFYVEIGIMPQSAGKRFIEAYNLEQCTSSQDDLDKIFKSVYQDLMDPSKEVFELKPTRS
jgi:hypothetical protein